MRLTGLPGSVLALLADAMQYKGVINVPADFPTLALVEVGWTFTIGMNVTDNDATKTNTGQTFLAGQEITWNGINWTIVGDDRIFVDDGTDVYTLNDPRNFDFQSGKLKDNFVTAGIALGEIGQTALDVGFTNTSIVGALNELFGLITADDLWDRVGTNTYLKNTADFVGLGTSTPDTKLHIMVASAGVVSAAAGSVLCLENTGSNYLQFLSPDTGDAGIIFGDVSDNIHASLKYDHNIDSLILDINASARLVMIAAETVFNEDAGDVDFRIESTTVANAFFLEGSTGNVGFGTSSPFTKVHVSNGASGAAFNAGSIAIFEDMVNSYSVVQHIVGINQYAVWSMGDSVTPMAFYIEGDIGNGTFSFYSPTYSMVWTPTVIQVNANSDDVDFQISGDLEDYLLFIDAGASFTSVGGNTQYGANKFQTVTGIINYGFTQATVNTTDAVLTTIQTLAIPTNKSGIVEARIVARRTGGIAGTAGDSAAYIRTVGFKNVAGVVSIISPPVSTSFTAEDQAPWNATISVSGTNLIVQVSGAVNNNITWDVTTVYQEV